MLQAFHDAKAGADRKAVGDTYSARAQYKSWKLLRIAMRADAREWLTEDSEELRRVCANAGIDADKVLASSRERYRYETMTMRQVRNVERIAAD